ncbi:MAG: phosphodiesterase [Treponema sp.]|nr:phosphodiesterase [Treponema sp.]
MKYLICSDIHGSLTAFEKIIDFFDSFNCDKLLLLGDLLYHGPRNPLPQGHNPKELAIKLNSLAHKIIACRGNCDAEVDQMVLNFPLMGDYFQIIDQGVSIFASHGHIYAPVLKNGKLPKGCESANKKIIVNNPSLILYGHTHVQLLEKNEEGNLICNPGSISLPKEDSPAGFAIYEKGLVSLYNLQGQIIKSLGIND